MATVVRAGGSRGSSTLSLMATDSDFHEERFLTTSAVSYTHGKPPKAPPSPRRRNATSIVVSVSPEPGILSSWNLARAFFSSILAF